MVSSASTVLASGNKSGQGLFSLSGVALGKTSQQEANSEGCVQGRGNFCTKDGTVFYFNPANNTYFSLTKKASEPAAWPDKWYNMGLNTSLNWREAFGWMESVGLQPGKEGDKLIGTMITSKRFLRIAISFSNSRISEVNLLSTPRPQYERPAGL